MSPKGKLISGHLKEFREDPLAFLTNLRNRYEDVVKLRFGPKTIYVITKPEMIKEVLVTKQKAFLKSRAFKELKPFLGEGLLTSEKDFHMRQRRLMQPSFKKGQIQRYADDMVEITQNYIKGWQEGEKRVITNDMMNIALAIITKTMFNMEIQVGHEAVGKPIDNAMKIATGKIRSLIKMPRNLPTKQNREFNQSIKILDEVVYGLIEERRKDNTRSYNDLLSVLMEARDEVDQTGMTDQQLRDEAMTVFLAGHETTANALSWTFYLLSQHPEKEARLQKEIDTMLEGRPPTADDAGSLPYTSAVIMESLRLYPPAWNFGREACEDIEIGGYAFRKGDTLMISPYLMHHHPGYFEAPEEFIPERFENNFLRTVPPYVYFPFGGGPRVCIGNHFATMEATLVLATIVQHYSLELKQRLDEIIPEPLITLRPKNGINMVVHKR
ncbi:cytochrome P450 [Pseudalkalibacillus caeni]|uniref:Cytochrome P450 n=2 Tax=Exobacillus caeni TaxID=2574798 RepID=A0A5R9F4L9_9BACL|nr:cytochrome P450 [Pseudalkalibacillus caeni]